MKIAADLPLVLADDTQLELALLKALGDNTRYAIYLELARSVSLWATMSLAEHGPDPLVASRLQAEIGRTARHVSQESIQLHGGIGVTAEYSISHYAARLTVLERTLGVPLFLLNHFFAPRPLRFALRPTLRGAWVSPMVCGS